MQLFLVRFFVMTSILYLLFYINHNAFILDINYEILKITATSAAFFIEYFIDGVRIFENMIYIDSQALQIIDSCSSVEIQALITIAILSLRSDVKTKATWLVISNIALFVLNIVRIIILAVVVKYFNGYHDFFHYYLLQGAMILAAIIIFWLYIESTNKNPQVSH